MEFSIKSGNPEKQRSGCLIVGVFESKKLTLSAELLDNAAQGYLSDIMRKGDMEGKSGSSLLLHAVPGILAERVLLIGLGKEKEFKEKEFCAAIKNAIKAAADTPAQDIAVYLSETGAKKLDLSWKIRQFVIGIQESLYRFDHYKSKKDDSRKEIKKVTLCVDRRNELPIAENALKQGLAISEGITFAKDLGNTPPNICHPTWLAEQASALAEAQGLSCETLDAEAMQALGMNSLLAVAKGSTEPPKLIVLHYRGGKAKESPIVLVGKGVTFDTGGISLKPGADMDEMKYDMCGAAGVLGTIKAVSQMALPINLTVIVPAVENMPDGGATRPGDIVTSMSGQTIEILNTDAEGRLILCDALTYAERYTPAQVIDVATLTGACVVALGHIATGLFANKDSLAKELLEAGEQAMDRAWHMPLWDDYQDLLKSPFADMGNIGGRWGGAITAACFLARFTKKFEWAHLDIAGTAWKSGGDKGATGRPVRLLTQFLMEKAGITTTEE